MDEKNNYFSTDITGQMLLSKDGTELVAFPSAEGTVVLPETITKIKSHAFDKNEKLENIVFPNNLTEIGDGGFSGTSLKKVSIPKSVKKIGIAAFGWTKQLESVEFLDSNGWNKDVSNPEINAKRFNDIMLFHDNERVIPCDEEGLGWAEPLEKV